MRRCGCYYVIYSPSNAHVQHQKHYLPLLDSEAHSTILSATSRTVLRQTFTNPLKDDIIKDCTYTFPLYDGVSVVGFTCRIGDRVLHGLVKEKAKAKKIFDDAVAKGETAGLLVQEPEASDVFSTILGNIPAGQSMVVEITYVGELKSHETDGIRFTIPTSIAPRYGPEPGHAITTATPQRNSGIKITVDVNMPGGSLIKGVQSPSHPIAVSMGTISTATDVDPMMSKASATLSLGSAALEKDFVLVVISKDVGIPKAVLETHPTIPGSRALMATLVPKFSLPPSRPEIVFVADRSGSMESNITMLKSAMGVFLKSMPVGVKFNICSFGSTCNFLWPKSESYSRETLEEASRHLQTFDANMGGTETFNAIKATIDRRFTDIPLEIILLTDGDIWSQNELFEYVNQQVKSSKGNIRVFPLGIGNGVSHSLIEGLARAGNGFAQSAQDGERFDDSVVRMLRGALSPHITDYTLEIKYEQEDDDFELIDTVDEGMKVLLSDDDSTFSKSPKAQATISLFNAAVNPEKDDIKDSISPYEHLPKVPTPKLLQAPHQIPTLFAFSRTSVYLLMAPETVQRNPTSVILRATSPHGPLALEFPVDIMTSPGETIHQLAAKKAVQDLEEGRGWLYDAKNQKGNPIQQIYPSCFSDLVEKEAVRLGEKFQIAGKWTSFVAVEANEAEMAAKEKPTQIAGSIGYDSYDEADMRGSALSPTSPSYSPVARLASTASPFPPSPRPRLGFSGGGGPAAGAPAYPSALRMHRSRAAPVPFAQQQLSQGYQALPGSHFGETEVKCENLCSQSLFGSSTPQAQSGPSMPMNKEYDPSFALVGSQQAPAPPPMPDQKKAASAESNQASAAAPKAFFRKPFEAMAAKMSARPPRARRPAPHIGGEVSLSEGGSMIESDTPPRPEAARQLSPIEKIHVLISLQDFEGFWPCSCAEQIQNLLGLAGDSALKGKSSVEVTIAVVVFMEKLCVIEQGTWALVVEKAKAWLLSEDGGRVTGEDEMKKMEDAALISLRQS